MSFDPEMFGKAMGEAIQKAIEPLKAEIQQLKVQLAALPEPKEGPAGKDGADGKDGKSFTLEDAQPLIEKAVALICDDAEKSIEKAVAAIPAPKDGKDGADGRDGKDGKDGADGKDAEPVSEKAIADAVAAMFERRFSDLTLSWERQANDEARRAIDRMPIPKDGKDAAPIDTFDIVQDERSITVKLGDVERTFRIHTILDRGVWEQRAYEKGDAVSYGSSLWIAQDDTEDAPGTSKAWRLAVKKGRDGMDLRDNASKHNKDGGVKV